MINHINLILINGINKLKINSSKLLLVSALAFLTSMSANAQMQDEAGNPLFLEVKGDINFPAFGTSIGLYNGQHSTTIPVVSLPGNSDIDVGVYLERSSVGKYTTPQPSALPVMTGVLPCGYNEPVWRSYIEDLTDSDFTMGVNVSGTITGVGTWIIIPGRAPERVGISQNQTEVETLGNYYYKCVDDYVEGNSGPGSSPDFSMTVEVYTPDGIKYVFDQMENPHGIEQGGVLWASYAEDTYGNRVDYIHEDGLLSEISASDGRRITFEYGPAHISSDDATITISANGRRWVWAGRWTRHGVLDTTDPFGFGEPRTLQLPDNTTWEFDTTGGSGYSRESCGSDHEGTFIIKNPEGSTLTLNEQGVVIFSATGGGVDAVPPKNQYHCDPQTYLVYFNQLAASAKLSMVTTATVTGPDLSQPYTWDIEYEEGWGRAVDQTSPYTFPVTRTLSKPDNSSIVYTFESHKRNGLISSLISADVKNSAGDVLATYEPTYQLSRQVMALHGDDTSARTGGHALKTHQKLLTSSKFTIGDDVFETTYQYNESGDWDKRNLYTRKTVKPVDGGTNRVTDFQYKNLLVNNGGVHRIGLLESITQNGKQIEFNTYNAKGKLSSTQEFAETIFTHYTYTSQGMINTITNQLGTVDEYSDYKRGKARKIIRAKDKTDEAIETFVVDDNGWVTAQTDPRGFKTTMTYDLMGRLKEMDYDDRERVKEVHDYTSLGSGLVETVTTGHQKVITTYDGLMRPVLEKIEDTSGDLDDIYTVTEYDPLGRIVFTSWPSDNETSEAGEQFEYDALARLTSMSETVAPFATNTYTYLSGDKTRTTDPDNKNTTITYSGFYPLGQREPIKIESPEGVTTEITRNIWGLETGITQSGSWNGEQLTQTQRRYYNNRLLACAHYTPETGYKRLAYDKAGNVTRYQDGASSGSACQAPSGSNVVKVEYDSFHRETKSDYVSTGTKDIRRTYDLNGNLTAVNRGGANWVYSYDNLNQLTDETLTIDGLTFNTHYDYNQRGHVSSIRYPSGDTVSTSPDAFGRPSALTTENTGFSGTYADNIAYHANQSLKSFDYGNGVKFEQLLNDRQLPESRDVWKDSLAVLDYEYEYDSRANTTKIIDNVDTSRTVTNSYDGLSRLKTANSGFGNVTFHYDPLGNLRSRTITGGNSLGGFQHNVTVNYNANNRVSSVTDTNGSRNFSYDPRGNVVNNGEHTFSYDLANQPTNMDGDSDAFVYDGNLKRVKKTTGNEDVYFVYTSGAGLVSQYNATTETHTDYIRLAGQTIARVESAGSIADASTLAFNSSLASQSDTGLSGRDYYLPYGKSISGKSADDNAIGFTGHIKDDSGLTYMQARYYDPVIGRFYSNDPVDAATFLSQGNIQGFNRYAYANNNPYKYTDPDGNNPKLIADFALNVALNYVTTGQANVLGAAKETISGALNPAKTLKTAKKLADAINKSSTLKPGKFAGESVPARGPSRNFTKAERQQVNDIGKETGCHTCGTKDPGTKSGNFVPDHQPPNALTPPGGSQSLLPHCKTCSGKQAGEVTQAKRKLKDE